MKYVLAYFIVSVLTFMGLTTYWLRVKRPCDFHTEKEWSENDIAAFGILQAMMWPIFIPLYAVGMTAFMTFKGAKSWIEVAAPAQRVVLETPKKDAYVTAGEVEVDKFLDRGFALLESIYVPEEKEDLGNARNCSSGP